MKKILLTILISAVTLTSAPAANIFADSPANQSDLTTIDGIETEPVQSDPDSIDFEQTDAESSPVEAEQEDSDPVEAEQEDSDSAEAKQENSDSAEAKQEDSDPAEAKQEDSDFVEAEQEDSDPAETEQEDSDPVEIKQEDFNSTETETGEIESEVSEQDVSDPESIESDISAEKISEDKPGDGLMSSDDSLLAIDKARVSGIQTGSYTGQNITQSIKVSFDFDGEEKLLSEGTDYTVAYRNNINAGTAQMIITGKGRFTGTASYDFLITPAKLASIKLSFSSLTYKGTPCTQSRKKVAVRGKKNGVLTKLTFGTDYTLRYENNTEIGTAHIYASGIGNYTGTVSAAFKIIPKRTSIRSLEAGTGKIAVYWKEKSGTADGYEVQACLSKDFSSDVKKMRVGGGTRTACIIKGLDSGQKYYIRVRTYKKVGNKKYYSGWSAVKSRRLTYNSVSLKGSGKYRTIVVNNPKASVATAKVAVWTIKGGQDDLKWYSMKKRSDGSWYAKVYACYLKRSGKVVADVYANTKTMLRRLEFRFTKAEYQSTKNTIKISGSGSARTVRVINPVSGVNRMRAAVWTKEGGQDDIKWYTMKKQSDGSWRVRISMNRLLHSGNSFVHVYANTNTFLGSQTFIAPNIGFPVCQTEEEYIARIAPAVVNACNKYGYLPSVLIAQSCLENGYGIPSYWDNPEISALMRYNNMVGMKTSLLNSSWDHKTVWPGESIIKQTPEEYDGVRVTITDSFRVYDNIEQSFEDFLLFLTYASNYGYGGTPKYGPQVLAIKEPEKLIKTVAGRGYATDSSYATSVMRIINKHNLTQYDP